MTVDSRALHALAHAVRMRQRLAETEDHPLADEYANQLKIYRYQWAILSPSQRVDVVKVAESVNGLSAEAIASAVADLEG